MMDITKYKEYIAIFPKDSDRICALFKSKYNNELHKIMPLPRDYGFVFGDMITKEDLKYNWMKDMIIFIDRIDNRG